LGLTVALVVSSTMVTPAGAVGVTGDVGAAADPRVVVDAPITKFGLSPVRVGANNNKWFNDAQGLWDDAADAPVPDAVAKAARAGVGLIRYPGGTPANLFDWKRAVGPRSERACQTDANKRDDGDLIGRTDNDYGPSEHMELVQAAGAQAQIMVPFPNESPADAADWVEYMNAPVGTNPNGGIAWAEVRQADGSTAPYDVTRWEIGNEQDRGGGQAYWMAADDAQRLDQYIEGAEINFANQSLGRNCDFDQTSSNGTANQTFYLRYGLIKAGTSPTIKVGGVVWSQVSDFSTQPSGAKVYLLDRVSGSVTFGDGVHGAIPPANQQVTATYTFRHRGFVAMYDAMKNVASQIGIDIDVCAAWAPPSARTATGEPDGTPGFPGAMAARGFADRYDCVAMHPYTNFSRDFGDAWDGPGEGFSEHMLGDTWAKNMVTDLIDRVNVHSTSGPDGRTAFVTISELGALWFGSGTTAQQSRANFPGYGSSMTHAVYMTSQLIHHARSNVRWVEGNTLVAEPTVLRGVLGGSSTGFVYGAEAMAREAVKDFFAAGSVWTASKVENQQFINAAEEGGSWPVLVVGASTGADGKLRIVVINRRMLNSQTATVVPNGFSHSASVQVTTVQGNSFSSYNDGVAGGGDDSVRITTTSVQKTTGNFSYTFPGASVTVLTLTPL